jgi:IS5 family transposase
VPHPTTLLKLTRRFGPTVVEELNEAVLKTAVERKLLRSRRLRADTTVMEADIRRPTDSGLCAHAITRLSRGVRRIRAFGLASRTRFQDRSRSAGKIARRISHSLGRAHGRAAIDRLTGEMHRLAKAALRQASRVLGNARRGLRQKRRGAAAVVRLNLEVQRAERVIQQTARRLLGERVIADRLISLCDVDARPIGGAGLRSLTSSATSCRSPIPPKASWSRMRFTWATRPTPPPCRPWWPGRRRSE